jgi:hypothetical protein
MTGVHRLHAAVLVTGIATATLVACGGTSLRDPSANVPARSPDRSSNEKVLSRKRSERLVDWAESLRGCLVRRGFHVREPAASSRQVDIVVERPRTGLETATYECGDPLGGPPPGASLQLSQKGLVLYLPKRCLLDPNVERTHS